MSSLRRTWTFLKSRKWEYLGIIAFAAVSWLIGISPYWVVGTWVAVAIVGTIFWQLKPTPKVMTLPEIANANPDVDRQDLALLFSSGVDIHSKLWLFMAGVIIGLYSTGLPNVLQAEISILGTQTPSLIVTYTLAFLTIVVALIWLTRIVTHSWNPFQVRQKLFEQYLEARRILAERDRNHRFGQESE